MGCKTRGVDCTELNMLKNKAQITLNENQWSVEATVFAVIPQTEGGVFKRMYSKAKSN